MKLNIGKVAMWALNNVVVPAIAKQIAKNEIEPTLPPRETVNVVKDQIGNAIMKQVVKHL